MKMEELLMDYLLYQSTVQIIGIIAIVIIALKDKKYEKNIDK